MTRDYKKLERRRDGRGGGSSFLVGMLLGLVLGLGIALGVAWYVNRMPSPFLLRSTPSEKSEVPGAGAAKAGVKEKTAKADDGKPRFDFYKILPGQEEPATDKEFREASKARATEREAFYLQAGAFQNAPDADTLKARLALLGIEVGDVGRAATRRQRRARGNAARRGRQQVGWLGRCTLCGISQEPACP